MADVNAAIGSRSANSEDPEGRFEVVTQPINRTSSNEWILNRRLDISVYLLIL